MDEFFSLLRDAFYKIFPELQAKEEPVDTNDTDAYDAMLDAIVALLDEGHQAWSMKRLMSFTTQLQHHEKPCTIRIVKFTTVESVIVEIDGKKQLELYGYGSSKENDIFNKAANLLAEREKLSADNAYTKATEAIKRS